MQITLELWHVILLLSMALSAAWAMGRVLLGQTDRRLDERHKVQMDSYAQLNKTLLNHLDDEKNTRDKIAALERQFLKWQGDLPLHYVRRDDFIRTQTTIETKIDGLALRIENALLKRGIAHD